MATQNLTPEQLYTLLKDHVVGGEIALSSQLLPEVGEVVGYLVPGSQPVLTLTGVPEPTLVGRTVTLEGAGTFLGVPNAVTLVATITIAGQITVYLLGRRPASAPQWGFRDSFKSLPPYTGFDGRSLVQRESFFYTLTVSDVV